MEKDYRLVDTSRRRRSTVHSPCVHIYLIHMFYVQASPISMIFSDRKVMSVLTFNDGDYELTRMKFESFLNLSLKL